MTMGVISEWVVYKARGGWMGPPGCEHRRRRPAMRRQEEPGAKARRGLWGPSRTERTSSPSSRLYPCTRQAPVHRRCSLSSVE